MHPQQRFVSSFSSKMQIYRCARLTAGRAVHGVAAAPAQLLQLLHEGVDFELSKGTPNIKGINSLFSDFLVRESMRPGPADLPLLLSLRNYPASGVAGA